ncbi:hypothetical protein OKW43_001716 [Paraburkholderia sp. WC7.3g]|uniref:hypothetical protein n=1 Tax=Paraburkholderia sp. WC7.3g TaxID=2991070 RepID=UPI003D211924
MQTYDATTRSDQELFTGFALDAKGLPNRRLTRTDAAALLADAAQGANDKLTAHERSLNEALTGVDPSRQRRLNAVFLLSRDTGKMR